MWKTILRKQIFLPQDHGSWVFIFSPLLVGLFAGARFGVASLYLVIAAISAFLIRQPMTILVKSFSGRRSKADLPAARFWITLYSLTIVLALAGLIKTGYFYILLLAVPGAPVFAWHLWLVSRREERRQVNVEIIATGVLSLVAPAAFWVGVGSYDPTGWWLWVLTWLQSAASIVYAYLRLEQRELSQVPDQTGLWKMGRRAFAYATFNLAFSLSLGLSAVAPRWIFLPYLVQWLETMWGIFHPSLGWKPTRIGIRQLIVSSLWTILFVLTWRF